MYRMYCATETFVPDRDVYSSLTLRNQNDTPLCVESLRLTGFSNGLTFARVRLP